MESKTLTVPNIGCAHCVHPIKNEEKSSEIVKFWDTCGRNRIGTFMPILLSFIVSMRLKEPCMYLKLVGNVGTLRTHYFLREESEKGD